MAPTPFLHEFQEPLFVDLGRERQGLDFLQRHAADNLNERLLRLLQTNPPAFYTVENVQ